MKSVISIIIFIVLAIVFSKPEKATTKYIPLSFSFKQKLNNEHLSNLIHVDIQPDKIKRTYTIRFSKRINFDVKKTEFSFNFIDCTIKRHPALIFSCESSQEEKKAGALSALYYSPMSVIGKEGVQKYLLEIHYKNKKNGISKLNFLSSTESLAINSLDSKIKVSKNLN